MCIGSGRVPLVWVKTLVVLRVVIDDASEIIMIKVASSAKSDFVENFPTSVTLHLYLL